MKKWQIGTLVLTFVVAGCTADPSADTSSSTRARLASSTGATMQSATTASPSAKETPTSAATSVQATSPSKASPEPTATSVSGSAPARPDFVGPEDRQRFTTSIGPGVPDADRARAETALVLAVDSIILTDILNQDPTRTDLDPILADFYYGPLLDEREASVIAVRENGRSQDGWVAGTLEATETTPNSVRIEGCLDVSGVRVTDADGNILTNAGSVSSLVGVGKYDEGFRIAFLEYRSHEGERC